MSDQDFQQLRSFLDTRFTNLEQVLTAKMDAIDERRAHGDRELGQQTQFLNDRITGFTKELGGLEVQIERVQTDTDRALQSNREAMKELLHEEVTRVVEETRGTTGQQAKVSERAEARLSLVEDKLNAIKWAAVGLSIGSGVTSGGVVAFLTGTLG